jgi:predicted N-acyltransferase
MPAPRWAWVRCRAAWRWKWTPFSRSSDGKTAARLVTSAAEIGAPRWNALANPEGLAEPHPFTSYEFFAALEESGSASRKTGWQPSHLLMPDALMPLYVKNHSYGEYVFDHAWAEALERAGGDYYPKLQCSVPFTPVTGRRLLANSGADRMALLNAATGAVKQIGASSLHITFLPREEWQAASDAGYLLRTGQQFHWENRGYKSFDEFLGELSSAKRKNLRKERAAVHEAGVSFDWLTGSDITESHWDMFFDFYMDTGGRKWGTPYLTREFFSRLGQSLSKQILLVMAKRERPHHRRRLEPVRRRRLVWAQLGGGGACPLFAFRGLLLSGDRFRHRARAEKG